MLNVIMRKKQRVAILVLENRVFIDDLQIVKKKHRRSSFLWCNGFKVR